MVGIYTILKRLEKTRLNMKVLVDNKMKETKVILITGVAGFIGSHVAEKLLERGDIVIGIDEVNDYYSVKQKEANIKILNKYSKFKFYKGDISNYDFLDEIFRKNNIEYVGHIAARAGVRPSIENPFIYEQSNIKGSLNLLELAKIYKIKNFVLTSSSSVYGDRKIVPFMEEDDVSKPISPYAASKLSTELLAHTYHHLHKLNINIIRPFTIYGPRGRPDMAPFLFTKWVSEGKPIKKFGDGSSKRDYTYIDDFVNGFISAIDKIFGYEIFNLGNSKPISLNDFIKTIENVVGKKAKIDIHPMQAGDVSLTYANIRKAKEMLGYTNNTKLKEGISKFWEWYREFHNIKS
jgi:UDP-glucuronate 4-epimerase